MVSFVGFYKPMFISFSLFCNFDTTFRFAPLALNAVYQESSVECQRISKHQGWSLIYYVSLPAPEQPVYALFGSNRTTAASNGNSNGNPDSNNNAGARLAGTSDRPAKEVVLAIRGTHSVHDIVTDIRAAPQHFPPPLKEVEDAINGLLPNANASTNSNTNTNVSSFSLFYIRPGLCVL
jgi:hypothetical protein